MHTGRSYSVMQRMMMVARKGQFYVMLIVYMALATARPDKVMPTGYNDLVIHFVAYAVLVNSALFASGSTCHRGRLYLWLLAYSFLIELVQYVLPYRSFSLLDMLANALGLYAGLWIGAILSRAGDRPDVPAAATRYPWRSFLQD